MRRVVIDTNLYIDWINARRHEDLLADRDVVKYLSAIVMLELYAGAFSVRDRRVVDDVVAAFDRRDRILVPSRTIYEEAGHVLRALRPGAPSLVNDVLIALSARSLGATVITSNIRDFAAIRAVRPFALVAVST